MLHQLENEGIQTDITRNPTYSATESYYLDLLACHDNIIKYKPNAIHNKEDGEEQLAALTMMKALLPRYIIRNLRHGFALTLTDLHPSNIFVDSNWNITKLIDLEWACSLPTEMLHPPYWLTGQAIDMLEGEELKEYTTVHRVFMDIFEREEKKQNMSHTALSRTMWRGWEIGNF